MAQKKALLIDISLCIGCNSCQDGCKAENKLLYVRNSMEPFIYTVPDTAFDFLPPRNRGCGWCV